MPMIFISYKRQDKDKVFSIVEEIKHKTGVDCWIDLEGIESGDQFQNVIIDAIDKADIFVFMLSKNFIAPYKDEKTGKIDLKKQTFPEKEVMYALRHNKRLIPISIDGTSVLDCKWLEFNCSGLDCIDWNDAYQHNKLIKDFKQWGGQDKDKEIIGSGGITDNKSTRNNMFFFDMIVRNKGCSLTMTIVLLLFIVILPIGYFSFDRLVPEPIVDRNPCLSTSERRYSNVSPGHSSAHEPYFSTSERGYGNEITPDVIRGRKAKLIQSVDLALTSGTLWADMNIGAGFIGDYGKLYSWGEIETKGDYRQSCYTDINAISIIGTEYDVATKILGVDWQLPSQEQFDELIKECFWEWKDYGFSVVGKNGNSIFLPASGWSCSSVIEHKSKYGYYWTGEKVDSVFAKQLIFSCSEYKIGNGYLYYGRAVRAVRKKKNR